MQAPRLTLCIPTYRRASLLRRLLEDVCLQSTQPEVVIVVDGDPASGDVLRRLRNLATPPPWRLIYVPSNHANVAYQRFLAWRAARGCACDVLLYFDDDLRLPQLDTIEKLVWPLAEGGDVVGVTAPSVDRHLSRLRSSEACKHSGNGAFSNLARRLASSGKTLPGGLTPVGHRRWPEPSDASPYAAVQWLQGRAMAYRMAALDDRCFPADLFALFHMRWGLGEDTLMSRGAARTGRLVMALNTRIEHPGDDTPKAYPHQARALAHAIAYSRRFLNDHYRSPNRPTLSDRVALLKNYVGVTTLAWLRAFASLRADRFAYAVGYTQGAIRGLVQRPTAKNLTPAIDWWADAEKALAARRVLREGHAP